MKKTTVEQRFWSKVEGNLSSAPGCLFWRGTRSKGYGRFQVGSSRAVRAHRWIYEQLVGKIPDNTELGHTCNNPSCVNFNDHLQPISHLENMRQMVRDGRSCRGEDKPHSILTEKDVIEIRLKYVPYTMTQQMLAHQYGVSQGAIADVINGRTWAWL